MKRVFLKRYSSKKYGIRNSQKMGVSKLTCPIDGFKAVAIVDEGWIERVPIEFKSDVCLKTGEIFRREVDKESHIRQTIKYRGTFEKYKLKLTEVEKKMKSNEMAPKRFVLEIRGSFHKNYHGNNAYRFYIHELQSELSKLSENLKISLKNMEVKNIEFGLNINLGYSPEFLIERLKSYRRKRFYIHEGVVSGHLVGKYCVLSEYVIKIYDKSYQSGLGTDIIRFEIGIKKMRKLTRRCGKSQIFLSDLLDRNLMKDMKLMLIDLGKKLTWDKTLINRRPIKFHKLWKGNRIKLLLKKIVLEAFGKN